MPKQNAKCIDFGTGCGIIPFYWIREGVRNVCAVELQSLACDQLRRSIKLSDIGAECVGRGHDKPQAVVYVFDMFRRIKHGSF